MSTGAVPLRDYPGDQVRIACQPCSRDGRYGLARLFLQHGPDIGLPDLLARITAECPKRQDWRQHGPCAAGYPDLAIKAALPDLMPHR